MLVHLVVNHLEAAVGHEHLRHADALGCLVILQNGGYDARQSQCRTVEGVAQLNLLVVSTTEATVQAVGLIALEVGYRGSPRASASVLLTRFRSRSRWTM